MRNFFYFLKKTLTSKSGGRKGDRILIMIIWIILAFGLVMLSSATTAVAYSRFQNSFYYFNHQLFGLGLGLIAFLFFSNIDYHLWKKYAFIFLFSSIILLLLVFIPGLSATYGKARSWINIFGFSLQPSEFVKISFLLYLAAWLETRGKKLHDFAHGFGPFLAILGVIVFLLLLQPDVGTLFIIAAISLTVYFVGGGKTSHIIMIVLVGMLGMLLMVNLRSYQMDRFRCLVDPQFDIQNTCYQTHQSLIAIGSGGFWGRGLGNSRQKFMYLPEVGGDSIFAVIAEEMGLVFGIILIGLYFVFFYRGYIIARNAPDVFGRIMAIGIVTWIITQATLNIGGMINILPMTGVPLPFISYGGSAIMSALAASGILVNISKY